MGVWKNQKLLVPKALVLIIKNRWGVEYITQSIQKELGGILNKKVELNDEMSIMN